LFCFFGIDDVSVDCMEYVGENKNCFHWPERKDVSSYPNSDIISMIMPPTPINRRHFGISENDFEKANQELLAVRDED